MPGQFFEVLEDIGAFKSDVFQAIAPGVLPRQGQGRLGGIDADHLAGPGTGGEQPEAAGIAKGIEDAPAGSESRHLPPIVALVEVEAGLLPFSQVDNEANAVLLDLDDPLRRAAAKRAVVDLQAFDLANTAFGAKVNAGRPNEFVEQVGQQITALRQGERGELHHEPAVVAINGEARQAITLAEDQPTGRPRSGEPEYLAQPEGGGKAIAEEPSVERDVFLPAIEANADLAAAVEQPASDEAARIRDEIDLVPVGRLPLDGGDGPGEDPGMSTVERPGSFRQKNDARGQRSVSLCTAWMY